jgi:hypothetical protein
MGGVGHFIEESVIEAKKRNQKDKYIFDVGTHCLIIVRGVFTYYMFSTSHCYSFGFQMDNSSPPEHFELGSLILCDTAFNRKCPFRNHLHECIIRAKQDKAELQQVPDNEFNLAMTEWSVASHVIQSPEAIPFA